MLRVQINNRGFQIVELCVKIFKLGLRIMTQSKDGEKFSTRLLDKWLDGYRSCCSKGKKKRGSSFPMMDGTSINEIFYFINELQAKILRSLVFDHYCLD